MSEQDSQQRNNTRDEEKTGEANSSDGGSFQPSRVEWDMNKRISWNSLSTGWKEFKEKAAAATGGEIV